MRGSPAHAGIVLAIDDEKIREIRFPRTRGDSPGRNRSRIYACKGVAPLKPKTNHRTRKRQKHGNKHKR